MTSKYFLGLHMFICLMNGQVNAASFDGDAHITSMIGLSFGKCINECMKRVSCRSLTFERRSTFCSLYNQKNEDYSQTRTPWLLYWNGNAWPKVEQVSICNDGDGCKEGEACDGQCTVTECSAPSANAEMQFLGNLRTIGSKVKFTCRIGEPKSKTSTCTENGTWTDAGLECKAYGYGKYSNLFVYNSVPLFSLYTSNLLDCMETCNGTMKCLGFNFHVNDTCTSYDYRHLNRNNYTTESVFYYKSFRSH